ncbi:MAG: molybdopterin oxidoreductase family protein [Rhodospirillales bacterium]|nr:molybdopterin oxidoreductase family protein [Rhodospirillales bacterium]
MPPIADEVVTTTCYMCACRCGIRVHKKDGEPVYIDGNSDHPVNKGVLCAKGAAGLMNHRSPARLTTPMKRVGKRGENRFEPISWDEALDLAVSWLKPVRDENPKKLAMFTGRDQSQAFTGWWAGQFGTPNYAAHGGFCSVNMAAAGLYTTGGSFWEFGEPDWERTEYLMLFGVAEDHASNPLKIGLGQLKSRGVKVLSVNPVRTGYSAIADEWIGIAPGTDGLLVMALCHELLRTGRVDVDYLIRYTNAPQLVIQAPDDADDGLIVRNDGGTPLVWDRKRKTAVTFDDPDATPALKGTFELSDGRKAVPAFELIARRCLDDAYSPEAVADQTGVAADDIGRIASELAEAAFEREVVIEQPWTDSWGRKHDRMVGRPISMHAMRGISAHSNGFHTCRSIHILQILLGSVDTPGGHRYRPPYPRHIPCPAKPTGKPDQIVACQAMPGMPLGFPGGPEDLLIEADGTPVRIDKAYSWDAPLAIHGMMHSVIANAWKAYPYPIDTLFMFMANMAWNSAMNTTGTAEMLTDVDPETGDYRIPHIIYADAYQSEMVAYADLVLPDTTYLERWDCISLLDRPISDPDAPADAIRQPVAVPSRNVRPFQDVLIELGHRLEFPALTAEDGSPLYPGGYSDYLVNHLRKPRVGSLAGWRGANGGDWGKGDVNPNQLDAYIANGCHWRHELGEGHRFFKFANAGYLTEAVELGLIDHDAPITLQLYSEELQKFRLAARGHAPNVPPQGERERIETYCDPLPLWYAPFEQECVEYPLHAITQRPMAMYHAWGSQNAWLRQIHGYNRLYIGRAVAEREGLSDGEWAEVESRHGKIKARVAIADGVNQNTVWTWNAIGKRSGAWGLARDAAEATDGFLLNHLIDDLLPAREDGYRYANADPVTGQAAWYDLTVRVRRAAVQAGPSEPAMSSLDEGSHIVGAVR